MKKLLLITALALTCAGIAAPRANAQTAQFTFTPIGNISNVAPGATIQFAINLAYTSGPAQQDIQGLTYFLQVNNAAPFSFSITGRSNAGSPFTDLIRTNGEVTSTGDSAGSDPGADNALNPQNDIDLGGLAAAPMGSGNYFVANITLTIAGNAAAGTYTIQSTTTGGKTSVVNNNNGDTFPIQPGSLVVTVVPEPSTYALLALGAIGVGVIVYRRRATA